MNIKEDNYCDELKKNNKEGFIIPSKDNKWFFTFLVTLLNEKSFKLINSKIPKSTTKELYDIIKEPERINGYNHAEISNFIKSMTEKMDISSDLYYYLLKNNLYNYFLLPFYLKFLGFNCITFEYFEGNIYGGVYKYLKLNKNDKNHYYINNNEMKKSRGLKYDQRKENNPDYLIINLWNNNDKFLNSNKLEVYDKLSNESIIDSKTKIPQVKIEYNGYEYILNSQLLTNYNTTEYKKPEHTISITKCNNNYYAFSNSFYKIIPDNFQKKLLSYIPIQKNNKDEKPCTKLVELNDPYKKMLLSENSCILDNNKIKIKEIDEKNNYCFSIKQGKRVLIYIKGNKAKTKEEIAKEKEEAAEAKKRMEEDKKKAEQEVKDALTKKQPETPEQKAERMEKEKMCNVVYEYLKKIKTNKDKDVIFEKIKTEKDQINKLIKTLEEKEKAYNDKKKHFEDEIDKKQKENLDNLTKLLNEFNKKFKSP